MKTAKRPRRSAADVAAVTPKIELFFRHFDRYLYGERSSEMKVCKMLLAMGVDSTGIKLRPIIDRQCKFYRQQPGVRRVTYRINYTGNEWQRMMNWLRDADIDANLDTVNSVTRRMRYAGIVCRQGPVREAMNQIKLPLLNEIPEPPEGLSASRSDLQNAAA